MLMYLCHVVIHKVVFPDKISVIHRLEIINLLSYVHFKRGVSDLYTGKAFKKNRERISESYVCQRLGPCNIKFAVEMLFFCCY